MGTRQAVLGTAVAAGLLILGGCGIFEQNRETDQQEYGEAITSLQFDVDSGDLTVTTGDQVSVKRTIHYGDEKPGETVRVDGDALVLESCEVRNCSIDYEVVVPEGTAVNGQLDSGRAEIGGVADVNLQASSGDVQLRDVNGAVNLTVESGTIDIDGVDGTATLAASSGDISARNIGGATQVDNQSGTVTVSLTKPESVRVRAESGDIDVTVPKGSYTVTAQTDSGDVSNGLGEGTTGTYPIDLHAESGNITVGES
jgi:DUF4097 and DUF4098 domain-containing protein YvlB